MRFLHGLCFCEHCLRAASTRGVDVERLRSTVRAELEAVFASAEAETSEAEVEPPTDSDLAAFVAVRQETVSSLVRDIASAVRAQSPSTRVVYLDPSGATLGYASGQPTSERTAASVGWQDGIDLQAIAPLVDGIGVLGYFAEPARFERELSAYDALNSPLEVIMRPMHPDTRSAEQLRRRVASARAAGVRDLSFYHYGFMRLENLGWIAEALRQ